MPKKQARRKKTAARFVYMVDKANREGKRGILMEMKRAGLFAAVLCAVSLIAAAPVSANSWGLKGALYRAVASTHTWDDYSVVGGQGEDFALMGARYHNALFYAEDSAHLQVYHTAVWQPEDHVRQSIQQTDDGLILSAGSERYTFRREEGRYALVEAKLDGATVFTERSEDYGGSDVYWFSDGNRRVLYRATPLWLPQISIGLCSTQPGLGKICRKVFCARLTILPARSKRMARELVVPWSSARTYFATCILPFNLQMSVLCPSARFSSVTPLGT